MSSKWIRIVMKARQFVDKNICTVHSVEEVARQFDVERERLYTYFCEMYNINPKKYILNKKMEKIIELIQSTGNREISFYYANYVGYKTAAGLCNFIKRRTGFCFTEFRERVWNGWIPEMEA